ncbi:hypothetical protein ACFW91_11090 [Streptomyces asoensis]|uniref:hypothetical protein n=1 Tax=Streptomyces asoensis TaxID=249586 RepID=UPI0036AC0640
MAAPHLSFRSPEPAAAPPGHVTATGHSSFRLHEHEGRYPLPVVTLHPDHEPGSTYLHVQLPGRLTVRSAADTALPPGLARALQVAWSSDGDGRPVIGDLDLVRDAAIETVLVHLTPRPRDAAPRGYGESLYVDVFWEFDVQGPGGRTTVGSALLLEFAPPGAPPEQGPGDEPEPEFLRLREPSAEHFHEFAVVDFGTTASTVTLQSSGKLERHSVDPAQSATMGRFLTELLTPGAVPQGAPGGGPLRDAPEEWRDAAADLLARKLTVRGVTEEVMTGHEALALVSEGNEDAVSALQLEVEQAFYRGSRELRTWLTPLLHHGYTAMTQTPPLRLHGLRPVPFVGENGRTTFAPPSSLVETESQGDDEEPRLPENRTFHLGDGPGAITGLKRLVMRAQVPGTPGSELSPVHLTQHLYLRLVEAAERLTADKSHPGSTLQTVIVTYPTTALPEVRQRLGELVGTALGAPIVITDYDEGLAAGLFFVMRELSGNQNLGLEALRARSRRVTRTLPPDPATGAARTLPVSPPTWERTMLVIDIGGGTTDIALLQLALTDATPERPDRDRAVSGRRYRLEPMLLASTGHEQLGGDLLTLQVFYWLKAVLIDELREDDTGAVTGGEPPVRPAGRSLAAQVADQAGRHLETIVHPDVRETLHSCLPTTWDATSQEQEQSKERDRFHELWRLAEEKKQALGTSGDRPVVLEPHEVTTIVQGAPGRLRTPSAAIPLDVAQFERLMLPVLRRAAEMGADLVRTTFERERENNERAAKRGRETGPAPVLDLVVLSGRTSSMSLVGSTVTDVLSRADSGTQLKFGWDPMALSIETEFAKQATSLGAAWAHNVRNHARVGETVRGDRVGHRRMTDLDIETRGLFSSLPCDLGPLAAENKPVVLLRAGEPFVELDERGTLGIRSPQWNLLPRLVELHRITSASRSIQWGTFDLALAAKRDRIELSNPIWQPQRENGVKYLVEVDQELRLQILLCNGTPHYWVDGTRHHLKLAELVDGASFDPDLGRCRLPGRLCVTNASGGLTEVFPPPGPGGEDDYFDQSFHPDADSTQHTVAGRIAVIPVPPVAGQYEFHLDDGGGNPKRLDVLAVPDATTHGQQRLHMATLDARGHLSVYRGAVPFAPALNLRDVEREAGRVHSRPMDRGRPDFVDEWDPFTGAH